MMLQPLHRAADGSCAADKQCGWRWCRCCRTRSDQLVALLQAYDRAADGTAADIGAAHCSEDFTGCAALTVLL